MRVIKPTHIELPQRSRRNKTPCAPRNARLCEDLDAHDVMTIRYGTLSACDTPPLRSASEPSSIYTLFVDFFVMRIVSERCFLDHA